MPRPWGVLRVGSYCVVGRWVVCSVFRYVKGGGHWDGEGLVGVYKGAL